MSRGNPPAYNAVVSRHTHVGRERWAKIGVGFKTPKGISVSLDSLPIGEWDGTFMLFPNEPKKKNKTTQDRYDYEDLEF